MPRLGDFSSSIVYKIKSLNIKADALSHLPSIRHTNASLDEKLPTLLNDSSIQKEKVAFRSNSNVLDLIFLTHKDLADPQLVTFTTAEWLREEVNDCFSTTLSLSFISGNIWLFRKAKKKSYSALLSEANRSMCARNYERVCCTYATMQNHLDTLVVGKFNFSCFSHSTDHPYPSTVTWQYGIAALASGTTSAFLSTKRLWKVSSLLLHWSLLPSTYWESSWQLHEVTSSFRLDWSVFLNSAVLFHLELLLQSVLHNRFSSIRSRCMARQAYPYQIMANTLLGKIPARQ